MKPLSQRTQGLVQSDIRAITKLINAVDGINLGQGICDMPTPEPIKRAAEQAIEDDRSIYSNYAGVRRLREAVLRKAQSYNRLPVASEGEVMVSVGSTGAFVTAIFTLLEPGDEVILFEPFYGYHQNLLRLVPATLRYVRTTGPDWSIDFDAVRQLITPRTKAIVVCTPGNPSGKVWTRAELETLLGILQEHDLFAITDEIYEYMVYDGRKHVSLASLPGAYERTITISGFSKTFNMTGWRLGYAVGPEPIVGKMGLLSDLFYICAPTPLQYGVADAMEMGDAYFQTMLADYTRKRQMMCEALERIGFDVSWPQGAYYVMANFERFARTHAGYDDDRAACETLVRETGVGSIPGSSFFADPEDGRYWLRFCYAKEFPVLERACRQLVEAYG